MNMIMVAPETTPAFPPQLSTDDADPALCARAAIKHALWDQAPPSRTAERRDLEALIAQLREVNQNLVLAAVDAQTLRDAAEAAHRRQNEFLAMLAHELRNPLAPIAMAATLLGKTPDASPQLCHLQAVIERQVMHLSRLLDDLFDAARISSGKITLRREAVLLADLMERTIAAIQPSLDQRRQHLSMDLAPAAIALDGDPVRLAQVFSNLLLNASKFTQDHGRIAIAARLQADQVKIDISDNGAGMSAELLPTIFALFAQGPRSPARAEGGLGIGLNIVHHVVQLHGGTVTAGSAGLGCGSVFSVTLPVRAGAAPEPVAAPSSLTVRAGRKILLVEEKGDACDVLSIVLGFAGHAVSIADDGASGLAMARLTAYDVLICDIGMSEKNGMGLIRSLRNGAEAHLPLAIAMSGRGQAQDREAALAAGFDHYFVKPVAVAELLAAMASHADPRG
ncbi:signal transduction histidine kinase/ActR/RegA family two-component response regulator [Oxalobacteraceae bacterium GrIS 1.11]